MQIYGVDFSGAQQAGKAIWITGGVIEGDHLYINQCVRGDQLPGSGISREKCLPALRRFIQQAGDAVFGLDFPLSLPQALINVPTWQAFIDAFPTHYPDEHAFREACRQTAGGKELKRLTDVDQQTPFSPYNLRMFRQTYFGLRDVIAPLVRDDAVCVLPMQPPAQMSKPRLAEICPASTLKRLGLYISYKGKTVAHRQARAQILTACKAQIAFTVSDNFERQMIEDAGGDALDSLIAAVTAYQWVQRDFGIPQNPIYRLEGYVYS